MSLDLTTPEGVVEYMRQSTGERDWDDRVNQVKKANNGYPSFWWEKVTEAGLQKQIPGASPGITITAINDGTTEDKGTFDPVTHHQIS